MPFHTFIVNFKGSTYAAQGSYRNCKGFVSAWSGDLPDDAVPGLIPNLRWGLSQKAHRGEFAEVPNRKHLAGRRSPPHSPPTPH